MWELELTFTGWARKAGFYGDCQDRLIAETPVVFPIVFVF
jgi:hypothetical protein